MADLNLPHRYLAPLLGVTPSEFRRDFWRQKTRGPGLSYGVVCMILRSATGTVPACNGQTDGRTESKSRGKTRESNISPICRDVPTGAITLNFVVRNHIRLFKIQQNKYTE